MCFIKLLVWKARPKPNQIIRRFLLISVGFGSRLYFTFREYLGISVMIFFMSLHVWVLGGHKCLTSKSSLNLNPGEKDHFEAMPFTLCWHFPELFPISGNSLLAVLSLIRKESEEPISFAPTSLFPLMSLSLNTVMIFKGKKSSLPAYFQCFIVLHAQCISKNIFVWNFYCLMTKTVPPEA